MGLPPRVSPPVSRVECRLTFQPGAAKLFEPVANLFVR